MNINVPEVKVPRIVIIGCGFGGMELAQYLHNADVQIVLLDIVFSLDSVITAVGMANEFWVMAVAVVIAVFIMLAASGPLSDFVNRHPTVKMLALSFLLLIGMTLVADGAGLHVPKGYIYAAIGFSVGVEALNQLAARRRRQHTAFETSSQDDRRRKIGCA